MSYDQELLAAYKLIENLAMIVRACPHCNAGMLGRELNALVGQCREAQKIIQSEPKEFLGMTAGKTANP